MDEVEGVHAGSMDNAGEQQKRELYCWDDIEREGCGVE